jgi:uncharacterized oxidoreductase
MNVEGKRVLITGGSSGIGHAMAQALARAGASVVITGRDEARVDAAAAVHPRIEGVVCDVTSDAHVGSLRDRLVADGGIDMLVNNAGVMNFFRVTERFPLSRQLEEIDIDVNGPLRMVDAFLPSLLDRPSIIVNVSSGLAWVPYVPAPVYSGAKAFVHAWTVALRTQLEDTSVRVIELLPPVTDTPLAEGLNPSFKRMDPAALVEALLRGIEEGKDEIAPGQSIQLKWLSRFAPRFIFAQLNRGATR